MSPAKHSYARLPDKHTDRQKDAGQSDPYMLLCFADDTKIIEVISFKELKNRSE